MKRIVLRSTLALLAVALAVTVASAHDHLHQDGFDYESKWATLTFEIR